MRVACNLPEPVCWLAEHDAALGATFSTRDDGRKRDGKGGEKMPDSIAVLGAPTSAGAHFPGLEQGPEHFRRAGLLAKLAAGGFEVLDFGDVPRVEYEIDRIHDQPRSVSRVSAVAREVAERMATIHGQGLRSLVVGGDCSITAGVVSGLSGAGARVGLVYLDGHVDLNTPQTSDYSVLDSMVMSHLFGVLDNEFSRLGPSYPMLADDQVLFIGFDPDGINHGEAPILQQHQALTIPLPELLANPDMVAASLRILEAQVDTVVVHFDVDVINFLDYPVANFPWYNGLSLEQASGCLEQLLASPKFECLVLTEFNPDRDKQGVHARRMIEILADRLRQGSTSWSPRD